MVPWGLQLLFYCLLYYAFPRDRDRSAELERQGTLRQTSSETSILDTASDTDAGRQG